MIKKKSTNKICKLIITSIVIFLFCVSFVNATLIYESYNSFEIKKIVGYTNSFYEFISQNSGKFDVPVNVLKSVFGVFTEGNLGNVLEYNAEGRIGVMGLIPFMDNGKSYHYNSCLESKCMSISVSDDSSVELKREQVKQDYINIENSLCCATYLLKREKEQSINQVVFPSSNNLCLPLREQVVYTDWEAAVRKFVGRGCVQDIDYLYFVEKYSQLKNAFDKYKYFKSYGLLKFTPSFSIKAPILLSIYDELPSLIKDLQTTKTENEVLIKLEQFEGKHKVAFTYCEEPEVNVINSIYDRLVNAYETDEDNCKYLIASQEPKLSDNHITFINISSKGQNPEVKVYDNNKEYVFNSDDLRFNGDRFLKIESNSGNLKYMFKDYYNPASFIGNFKNIYLLKNSSLSSSDFLFVFENQAGEFYNMLNNEIDISSYSTCKKKYKYFTCLDTLQNEEVFDWTSWSWKKADETIKIKFAFAVSK